MDLADLIRRAKKRKLEILERDVQDSFAAAVVADEQTSWESDNIPRPADNPTLRDDTRGARCAEAVPVSSAVDPPRVSVQCTGSGMPMEPSSRKQRGYDGCAPPEGAKEEERSVPVVVPDERPILRDSEEGQCIPTKSVHDEINQDTARPVSAITDAQRNMTDDSTLFTEHKITKVDSA